MRALAVVVHAVLIDNSLEVTLVDDQHPVQAFSAAAPDPALSMRICPGGHQRSHDHPCAKRLEDPISLERKLLVPIVDQDAELDPFVLELPAEIASLLGEPGGIRFRGAAPQQDSTRCQMQIYKDVEPLEKD